jgi:hypothetical protein
MTHDMKKSKLLIFLIIFTRSILIEFEKKSRMLFVGVKLWSININSKIALGLNMEVKVN